MAKIETIRGDTLCIAIYNIKIELDNMTFYKLSERDKFTFSICLPRQKPILQKSFPGDIQFINGNTIIATFLPEETMKLQCLNYDFDCKLDLGGKGKEIYTIAKGEMQIFETATNNGGS